MKKIGFSLLLFFFCSSVFGQKSIAEKIKEVESNIFPTTQIDDSVYNPLTIEERIKAKGIPGVSVAVINNYKLEWAKGYGYADKEQKIPVTPSTLFLAGSISKSVNAMGVLKLADQGKIDLEKNINDYLRSWKFPENDFTKEKKVSTANLLSHTAGLSVHGFPGYSPGDSIPTVQQILDGQRPANTLAVRSIFSPGEKFKYSGGGTTITQLMVEDVTGMQYQNYMEQEVLKPLGMNQSTYQQPYKSGDYAGYATAYYVDGKPVKGRFHQYPEMAAAGLWTNPTDLSKFVIEVQQAYKGKSKKVLSQNMIRKMVTHYIDSTVGLGVFLAKKPNDVHFSHGGADEGFRAYYFGSLEEGYGAIVMVNSDNGSIMNEIMNSIGNVYNWPINVVNKRKTVSLPVDSISRYTGWYHFNTGDSAYFEMNNGKLFLRINEEPITRVYFSDNKTFFTLVYPQSFSFVVNDKKEFDLHVQGGQQSLIARRKN